MSKNLIKQMMGKKQDSNPSDTDQEDLVLFDDPFKTKEFISTIEKGYLFDRETKFTKKKKFSPSKIAYGEGKCPRYWYLAFSGANFEDNATPFSVANMTSGVMSHKRVLEGALKNSGIAVNIEFDVNNENPPVYGICDGMVNWQGEDYVVELKTCNNDAFEYRKRTGKAKLGHIEQLLMYMKILNKGCGMVIYENKNTHELLPILIYANDHYKKWVDGLFDWMGNVRKSWEDEKLPMKPYRSNSKVCKNCPLLSDCSKAEAGVVKIEPLEDLSEAM